MKVAFLGSRGIPARYSGFDLLRAISHAPGPARPSRDGLQPLPFHQGRPRPLPGCSAGDLTLRADQAPGHDHAHAGVVVARAHAGLRHRLLLHCGEQPAGVDSQGRGDKDLLECGWRRLGAREVGRLARWYQLQCERIARHAADVVIADARGIQERYRDKHGVDTVFVPYGASAQRSDEQDVLARWGLEPRQYVFYVGALVRRMPSTC